MPLLHSRAIKDEHTRYVSNIQKLMKKRLQRIEEGKEKLSFDLYKSSYSTFVLVSNLVRKTRPTTYLQELKTEIVSIIGLGTLGFEISLHLRRCIELTLKHVYYIDHPVELVLSLDSEITKENLTVRDLFMYAKRHPLIKQGQKLGLGDPIESLETVYSKLCEIVHARRIYIPSKLENFTLPKRTADQIKEERVRCRQVMRDIAIFLIIIHKEKVIHFDALSKEATFYSLTPSSRKQLRSKFGI